MTPKRLTPKDIFNQALTFDTWQDAIEAIKKAKNDAIKEYGLQPSLIQWSPELYLQDSKGEVLDGFRGYYCCSKGLPKMGEVLHVIDDIMLDTDGSGKYTDLVTEGFKISYNVLIRTWESVADKMNGERAEPMEMDVDVLLIEFEGLNNLK